MCGGGSNYVSSSRAAGKAPAVPWKCDSKAFSSRKWKCPKMTADTINQKSFTYCKSEPKSELELLLLLPLVIKLK